MLNLYAIVYDYSNEKRGNKHYKQQNIMRQIFTNIKAIVTSVVIMAVVAGSVSCAYDDTAVWNEIKKIKKEIVQLRTDLEDVLSIVNGLEKGDLAIRKVVQQSDGSQLITLSNGKTITVYPKGGGLDEVITTTTIDGVRYWAMYNVKGEAQAIYVDGRMIPVADLAPETRVNDNGGIEVSFDGGNTWVLTGYTESITDTIISNVEVVYSDWQTDADGNPLGLYCVVTFSDGSTMKVGMQNGKLVLAADSMFVSYGNTGEIYIDVQDAVDYIIQTPDGWGFETDFNAKKERMILTVTAPTFEDIAAGKASSSDIVKLMFVFNNGSSAIARLRVTTNPAQVVFASEGLYIEVGYGVDYIVGALISKSAYESNLATYLTYANEHVNGTTHTEIHDFAFMETTELYVPYSELGITPKGGSEYYFWYAAPNTAEDSTLYIEMKDICAVHYKHVAPSLKNTQPGFFDLEATFSVAGYDEDHDYMLGLCPVAEFDAEAIAAYYTEYPETFYAAFSTESYRGGIAAFVDSGMQLDPGSEYVLWYLSESALPDVLVDNVYSWTFSTKAFQTGGSIATTVSNVVVEYTSVSMTLDSSNHIAMYYNLMPSYMATGYTTDAAIIKMLTTEGGKTYTTEPVNVEFTNAAPGTNLTLFAVAVDANGKYGKILKKEYTTKDFVYNDLALTAELIDYKIDNTRIYVACEGAEKYVFVCAQTNSEEWKSVYGGSKAKAGEFMIEMEGDSRICDTSTEEYALVDNHICLSNLEANVEYALVVMAVDAEGGYSQPQAIYFEPIANIGNVVKRTDENWEVGKPSIKVLEYDHNPNLFTMFSWEFIPGPHTRAYVATLWPSNFVNDEIGTNVNTVEKLIVEIISSCDTGTMSEAGISAEWQESGIYVREWTEWEDLDGDGYLEVVDKSEEREGAYHFFPYGKEDNSFIYVTWVGEDGNFHEPFAINPKNSKEVDIWTGAAL